MDGQILVIDDASGDAERLGRDRTSRRARLWQSRGIGAVPAVVIDGKYLISGGQPPEAFEKALSSIAAETA